MPTILIKNLTASVSLDCKAMRAIAGGARMRGYRMPVRPSPAQVGRIIDYPTTRPFASAQAKTALFKP